jgi:GAF domain-containing protein
MSPSIIFWVDTLVSLITGIAALALLLLVLGVSARRRLNQAFGIFIASAALLGLSAGVANVVLWLDSRVLADSGGLGNPVLWIELSALGFYLVGPALYFFSAVHVETETRVDPEEIIMGQERPLSRWHKALSVIGFLVGLAAIPTLLSHQFISDFFLDPVNDLPRWEITELGWFFSAAIILFELLALRLLLKNRSRPGGAATSVGLAVILIGGIIGALVRIPFPTVSASFAVGFAIIGYVITSRQIFYPLRTTTEHLEKTVAERTSELQKATDKLQRLNDQQRRVSEINREVSRASTPAEMIERLVQFIHDRLGYHHVYIYTPDEANQNLIARAAAGSTAQTVLERGHQLQIGGRSLVGQAAAQYRPRLAEARGEDIVYFSETALPSARAELALPLLVGGHLLGVLDLQSIYYQELGEEDVMLMTGLADQFAATLDSARLLQKTENALVEVEKFQQQYLRQTWGTLIHKDQDSASAYVYTSAGGVTPVERQTVLAAAGAQKKRQGSKKRGQPQTFTLPITLRGQTIGLLRLRHKSGQTWRAEDIEVLHDVANRLALALDNTRLQQETRRRANRDRLVSEIAGQVRGSLDPDTILKTTVRELGRALGAKQASVELAGIELNGPALEQTVEGER